MKTDTIVAACPRIIRVIVLILFAAMASMGVAQAATVSYSLDNVWQDNNQ